MIYFECLNQCCIFSEKKKATVLDGFIKFLLVKLLYHKDNIVVCAEGYDINKTYYSRANAVRHCWHIKLVLLYHISMNFSTDLAFLCFLRLNF